MELAGEVLGIAITIGHSLQCSDFVVDSFEWTIGDREVVPVENFRAVRLKREPAGTSPSETFRRVLCRSVARSD